MLCPCCLNPHLSAHKALEGTLSFDATPMAPLGTEVLVHIKPHQCKTWGYHAAKAWYLTYALNTTDASVWSWQTQGASTPPTPSNLPSHNTNTHHHHHRQDPPRNGPPHRRHCRHPGSSPRQNGSNPKLTSNTHLQNLSHQTAHTSPSSPATPYHLHASRSRHTQPPSNHRTYSPHTSEPHTSPYQKCGQ